MRAVLLSAFLGVLLMSAPALADQASAVQAVRRHGQVIDAKMDTTGNLYVFVKADAKASWGQFADYLCNVVKPHQGRIFKVRIVDVTKANFSQATGNWPRLGEASCAR